jgi:hypothetical protein
MKYDPEILNYNLNLSLWFIKKEDIFDSWHSLNVYSSIDLDSVPPFIWVLK